MAYQATGLHAKVSRLLSKEMGKPVLKANKPLALKNEVANRKMKKGEASCITEMMAVMACWKQNDFKDTPCSKEVQTFYRCTAKAQAELKAQQGQHRKGQGERLPPREANTLLRRHPNLYNEI
ncbi:small ribosomal subunit protein mS37 [Amia ocellicauda]|uniref:small ribosomal subunit protein mS37 n=1 Tax=Amia ocellicauda TaxID=2972642 RepID=UPI0034640297